MHGIIFQLIWVILRSLTGKNHLKLVQRLRNDNAGSGRFNAKRSHGHHMGVDILTLPGEEVYAPIDMYIERTSKASSRSQTSGIKFTPKSSSMGSRGFIWYFEPYSDVIGKHVLAGSPIGKAQDMVALDYPHLDGVMQNHVHVEHRDANNEAINIESWYV